MERDFGYKTGDPCVLIKLNRVRGLQGFGEIRKGF